MGLMHKLLEQALKDMRKKGQYICYLYPYSIPFYRRKGWELISDKISYEIKDYQLPKNRQVSGDVRRVKTDSVELKKTYERYAAHTHGAILRDELAWNEYWLWDSDDIMAAIYYNEKDEPDGYIICLLYTSRKSENIWMKVDIREAFLPLVYRMSMWNMAM